MSAAMDAPTMQFTEITIYECKVWTAGNHAFRARVVKWNIIPIWRFVGKRRRVIGKGFYLRLNQFTHYFRFSSFIVLTNHCVGWYNPITKHAAVDAKNNIKAR